MTQHNYDHVSLRITDPGKYENEPRYTPYFHEMCLNVGGTDEIMSDPSEDATVLCEFVGIASEDTKLFPELLAYDFVQITYSDTGHVSGSAVSHREKQQIIDSYDKHTREAHNGDNTAD